MVMTLVFLAMGFLLVIAVRSYFHWQKEELAKHEHLREKVERKGWRFETRPSRHVDLRISGTQDGIHWTIEQGNKVATIALLSPGRAMLQVPVP